MHWADDVAGRLMERGDAHVIETGTSISGIPHVGNASDVIRGDAVRKALAEQGIDVSLIWIADDSDPFRKVPAGFEGLKDYLGYPVHDIPDPGGCHRSFVEHFVSPFLDDLAAFGVVPANYSGTDLYRREELLEEIRIALERRNEIRAILDRFRETPLPEDWIPWSPICSECGRISTTKPIAWDGERYVSYQCTGVDAATQSEDLQAVKGCGYTDGASDIKKGEGKLPWRVEWAARWHRFKVTCEPFGKEHATAGGSYDGAKLISERIFEWPAPEPVVYEFFTLNGAKISSSAGNVITLADWRQIAEPEALKHFMYKRLGKQRDIDVARIPNLTDDYDAAERVYFGLEDGDDKDKRHYHLSQVGEPRRLQVPYTLCAVLAQLIPDLDAERIRKRLTRSGYEDYDEDRLTRRLACAAEWLTRHGPDYLRFDLVDDEEGARQWQTLTEAQKKGLALLADSLAKESWTPKTFHKRIYETARGLGLEPPDLFAAVYRVLIGCERGPKAALFVLSLEDDLVARRFRQA